MWCLLCSDVQRRLRPCKSRKDANARDGFGWFLGWRLMLKVHTYWGAQQHANPKPLTNEEKDQIFSNFVRQVADAHYPWLIPLLQASGATVYASPSLFVFTLPHGGMQWVEVPEMSRLITSVPWTEAQDSTDGEGQAA